MSFVKITLLYACLYLCRYSCVAATHSHTAYASDSLNSSQVISFAEPEFEFIDSFAKNAPSNIDRDSSTIAAYLLKGSKNDKQKARAVFTWIANNIKYDDNAFNSGKVGNMSAAGVLKRRHAVCEGYANLYKAIAQAMGLEVERIDGYAKAYGYRPGQRIVGTQPNHSWNAVKIDGEWALLDATWGAGYSDGGRGHLMSHKAFSPYWFNVNKYEFMFMHYPQNEQWLQVLQKVTLKQFEEMPFVQPAFFQMGFDAHEILNKSIAKTLPPKLADAYPTTYHLKLVDFPLGLVIAPTNEASFTIISDEDLDIEFINDPKKWYRMERSGNKYTVKLPLKRGELQVAIKGKSRTYADIIKYQVK